jgi:transposase InsO family protein
MKYAFIAEKRVAFPVAVLCRVLGVSRSGFYDFLDEPETERDRRAAVLAAKTRAVFAEHKGRYGSPRVCRELRARGDLVSEKRVANVMRQNGLAARPKKRFRATTDSKHDDPIAPNLLARDFTASGPNEAWVTDVTAIWTVAGWLFLAAIVDLFSRRVVGWATSANNDRALALDALRAALVARRPPPGLVHHSDRGSPYASADYRRALERAGALASMSRKGDCWDNAVAESFFATLKTEALGDRIPDDHDAATRDLREYIDGYYNTKRRHSFIDYECPIEFELKSQLAAMAA